MLKKTFTHIYKRIFRKYDTRVYNIGRVQCPFCQKDTCLIRVARKGWMKLVPFGKSYYCADTTKKFFAIGIFSKYGICREKRVKRRY